MTFSEKFKLYFKNSFPEIMHEIESCIITLKLCGYSESYYNTSCSHKKGKNKVYRCGIRLNKNRRIFCLYYDPTIKELYCKSKLNDNGNLMTNSEKIIINKAEDIKTELQNLILDI